ncbi:MULTISPECIES: hypothetical protein [unclassified Curtobacterium]|uniref:hypothetical protein n=1 Tax=unclassified Curtobacterium TaxID=257496 RepID=UPI0039AFC458
MRSFLERHPEVLDDLLIVGSELKSDSHGWPDLLALDAAGQVWVIELKLNYAPRKILDQVIGHATWVAALTLEDLVETYARYGDGARLTEDYEARFGKRLPGRAEMGSVVAIVASKILEHTHCQLAWLEQCGVPMRAYEYRYLCADGVEAVRLERVRLQRHARRPL